MGGRSSSSRINGSANATLSSASAEQLRNIQALNANNPNVLMDVANEVARRSSTMSYRDAGYAVSDTVKSNLSNMFYRIPSINEYIGEGSGRIEFHLDDYDGRSVTKATISNWFRNANDSTLLNNFDVDIRRSKHYSGWSTRESDGFDYTIILKRKNL